MINNKIKFLSTTLLLLSSATIWSMESHMEANVAPGPFAGVLAGGNITAHRPAGSTQLTVTIVSPDIEEQQRTINLGAEAQITQVTQPFCAEHPAQCQGNIGLNDGRSINWIFNPGAIPALQLNFDLGLAPIALPEL